MVNKTLNISLDDLCAVIHQEHPGEGWFTAAEVAEQEGITRNAAFNRLQRAYEMDLLDKEWISRLVYFRMKQ